MSKFFGRTFFIVIIALVIGIGMIMSSIASVASTNLTKALGRPVDISSITVGINSVTIKGLSIANVEGAKIEPAFSCDRIVIRVSPMDLLGDEPTVEEILVQSPTIGLEVYDSSGKDHNWKRIIESMPSTSSPQESSSGKRYVVKRVLITDTQLIARVPAHTSETLKPSPLAPIELKNLGKDNPAAMRVITKAIVDAIVAEITSGQMLDLLLKPTQGLLKEIIPGKDDKGGLIKGIFGK